MGTITERKRKNGSIAYMARVRIMREGKTYSETETFDHRRDAAAWIAAREKAAAGNPAGLMRPDDPTLAAVIDRYTEESIKKIGRTKAQVLRTIKGYDIAHLPCSRIRSDDIIDFARQLSTAVQPQTVANYLSHLGAIFAIARPAWGYPLDQQAMSDAFTVAKRLGLTSKSRERDRRPTLDELDRVLLHFSRARIQRTRMLPMVDVVLFALFSTRRQEEIVRIRWADLDIDGARVLVRDMKHPGDKIGNDTWVDLPPEALEVIKRQPRVDERIFPYSTDAIGANFSRATRTLGITVDTEPEEKHLRFHDLRHEGVSRLFEMGWNIPRVAAVSGHRSWVSLRRYTHLRQTGDKYAGWKWNPLLIKKAPGEPEAKTAA